MVTGDSCQNQLSPLLIDLFESKVFDWMVISRFESENYTGDEQLKAQNSKQISHFRSLKDFSKTIQARISTVWKLFTDFNAIICL